MFATIITAVLKALGDSVLTALSDFIQAEMHDRGLIKQGQASQAAAETAKSEHTEAAMAEAEASAPKTKDEALKRLEDGTA